MEEDDDLYDCVETEEAEGDEIYQDLMRSEPSVMPVSGLEVVPAHIVQCKVLYKHYCKCH